MSDLALPDELLRLYWQPTDIVVDEDVTVAAAFRFNKNQPRDKDGQWTDGPLGGVGTLIKKSVASTKKVTPAVIYKKHDDGAVIGHSSSGQRMRWDAGRKKFIVEKPKDDGWAEESALNKTSAYNDMKQPDKWFEPTKTGTNSRPSSPSLAPEPAPAVVVPPAETTPSAPDEVKKPKKPPLAKIAPGLQHRAVGSYKIGGYAATNRQLRTGVKQKLISMDTDDLIKGLDEAMDSNVLKNETSVWRGLNVSPGDLTPGTVIEDKAFLSTTFDRAQAEDFAFSPPDINANGPASPTLMSITVPAGSKALHLGTGEEELLLDRGAKLKITGSHEEDGLTLVDAELVHDEPTDAELPDVVDEPQHDVVPEIPQQADAPEIESTPSTYTGPTVTDYAGAPKDVTDKVRAVYLAQVLHEQRIEDRGDELRKENPDKYTGYNAWMDAQNDARAELAGEAPSESDFDAALEEFQAALPDYTVRDNIRRRLHLEASVERRFTGFAEKNGLGVLTPAVKADLTKRTKEAFAGKKVAVRVSPKTVEHILNDGRFKSQFESGKSKGKKDFDMRASVERLLFGIDDKPWQNAEKRPIYGYVAMDGIRPAGIGSAQLGDPSTDALSQYGQVQVVLKDSVRDRTTALFGDSLNNMQEAIPTPINDPDWRSFQASRGGITGKGLEGLDRSGDSAEFRAGSYAEAQIHGGISVDDIEEVVFPTTPNAALKKQLEDAGIPYRVMNFKTAADGSDEERANTLRIAQQDKALIEAAVAAIDEKIASAKGWKPTDWVKDRDKYEKQLKTINDALPLLEGTKTSPAKKVAAAKAKVANAKLTPDERKAIKTWQGADHTKIQKALRAGDTTPDVSLLDSAIEKSPPLGKTTLYRGLTPDFMPDDLKTPGKVFTDPGFLATSKSKPGDTMFENYNHVIISTPDGAKGLDVGSGPYDEVLLPRGSRLRIDRVEQNRTMEGTTVPLYDVHATLLTGDAPKTSDAEVALPDVPKQPEAPKIESTPEALSTTAPGYAGPSVKIPPTLKQETVDEYLALAVKQAKWEANPKSPELSSAERMQLYKLDVEIGKQSDSTVRRRIEQLGKIESALSTWQTEQNLVDTSTDDLKKQLTDETREAFADKKIGVRVTPQTLAVVMSDGRFKTQFETKTSAGYNSPEFRAQYEAQWFGIGQGLLSADAAKVDPEKRPIYGYVMVDGVRPSEEVGKDVLSWYGDIQVVLKDSVRKRTTAMFGDSLNDKHLGMPSPVDNPMWQSFTPMPRHGSPGAHGLTLRHRDVTSEKNFKSHTYAEAQIHDGVSTADIEEVVFAEQPDSTEITSQLDAAGIPWRIVDASTVAQAAPAKEKVAKATAPKQAEAPKIESTPTGTKLSVAEEKELSSVQADITKLFGDSGYWRTVEAEVTHKAGIGKVLTKNDIAQSDTARKKLKELRDAATPLAERELELRMKRDGDLFGDVEDASAERWAAKKTPSSVMLPGNDPAKIDKIADSYRVNDKKTTEHNMSIRSGDPSQAAKGWRSRMKRMINSQQLTNDAIVYRGAALRPERIMELRPGAVMIDPGSMSTDEDKSGAQFYMKTRLDDLPGTLPTIFEIRAPKGMPVADVHYGEYVFDFDTPMRIISTKRENGVVNVVAELVSPAEAKALYGTAKPAVPKSSVPTVNLNTGKKGTIDAKEAQRYQYDFDKIGLQPDSSPQEIFDKAKKSAYYNNRSIMQILEAIDTIKPGYKKTVSDWVKTSEGSAYARGEQAPTT